MIYYHGVILIQIHGTKSELSLYKCCVSSVHCPINYFMIYYLLFSKLIFIIVKNLHENESKGWAMGWMVKISAIIIYQK